MKIYVYAICKDEEKFVDRFMDSVKEADGFYILDTGSRDHTVELFKRRGAYIKEKKIVPWRFDVARNFSLKLVPKDADVCVCLDLDDIIMPDWRRKVEEAWKPGTTRLSYPYVWYVNEDGTDGGVFYTQKIHKRFGYTWKYPIHEALTPTNHCENIVTCSDLLVYHHPDPEKSRGQYLPLLELAYGENPEDDRMAHYLGREYMYHGAYEKAIELLKRHVYMRSSKWEEERSASMRFIAFSYGMLGNRIEQERWLYRAVGEAPLLREPKVALMMFYYQAEKWIETLSFAKMALEIAEPSRIYINEPESWGVLPYDLASIAAFHLGLYTLAKEYVEKAIALKPEDERIRDNQQLILDKIR